MNVQQTIIKGIKDQLFFHNYLVLPGFGGFVLKSNPAHISASGTLLVPPSKTVSFNIQLKQNDSILAIWLQAELQCTAAEALSHLHDFAAFCTSVLNARRRLTLEGIGFFYLDFENNLCFEPQQDSNFLTSSFGLAPVSIKQIETLNTESKLKKETVFVDRTLADINNNLALTKTAKTNYRRLIVPVIFLFMLFSLLVLFVSNTRLSGQLRASLAGSNIQGTYEPTAYTDLNLEKPGFKNVPYVADANGIAVLALNNDESIAVKALEAGSTNVTTHYKLPVKNYAGSQQYEIVLGCFSVFENASRMAAKLSNQNIQALVSGKNAKGLYVVSKGHFKTKAEALQQLKDLKPAFPNAWVKNPD